MHSTDDGRAGYPGGYHSYSDYSSDSLPSLPAGIGTGDRCLPPVEQWLAPCRIQRTCSIEVQTDRVRVREDGVGGGDQAQRGALALLLWLYVFSFWDLLLCFVPGSGGRGVQLV